MAQRAEIEVTVSPKIKAFENSRAADSRNRVGALTTGLRMIDWRVESGFSPRLESEHLSSGVSPAPSGGAFLPDALEFGRASSNCALIGWRRVDGDRGVTGALRQGFRRRASRISNSAREASSEVD
jgi:hypothetical protein